MAVVAGLIAAEKILPWRRASTYGTALILVAFAVPGLTLPADDPTPTMGAA